MSERIKILKLHLEENKTPILTKTLDVSDIPNSIILNSNVKDIELIGHYDQFVYYPPKWMDQMYQSNDLTILIINNIDHITKQEQERFIEILKNRQVSTFDIPSNYRIIITAKNLSKVTNKIKKIVSII